jgi:hypothetical protein
MLVIFTPILVACLELSLSCMILKKSATLRVQTELDSVYPRCCSLAHWLYLGSSTDTPIHSIKNVPIHRSTFIGKLDPSQDRYPKRSRKSKIQGRRGEDTSSRTTSTCCPHTARLELTCSPPAPPPPELPPSSTSTLSYPRDPSPSRNVQVD